MSIFYPYSQLSDELKARHDGYKGSKFLTWVKAYPYMLKPRFMISLKTKRDIDAMIVDGWQIIHDIPTEREKNKAVDTCQECKGEELYTLSGDPIICWKCDGTGKAFDLFRLLEAE